jgi:hypothetical protein
VGTDNDRVQYRNSSAARHNCYDKQKFLSLLPCWGFEDVARTRRCCHLDGLQNIMSACDASILDEVLEDISKRSALIVKRWWSSYGLPYATGAFCIELEVSLFVFVSQYSCVSLLFVFALWCREKAVAEVRLELLWVRPVLHRVSATTASYHEGAPRPIGVLPKSKATALLVIRRGSPETC